MKTISVRRTASLILIATLLLAVPSEAWGPKTQRAIGLAAARVLTNESIARLSKLESDVVAGSSVSQEIAVSLSPGFASAPLQAIQTEMQLLTTVRGKSIDAYFAYRLGVLGQMVAELTAPLADASPSIRDRYNSDVDGAIDQVLLKLSARKVVDPDTYFSRLQRMANVRKDLIVRDYKEGAGFTNLAKASLAEDVSRSVDAVADVWSMILGRSVVHAAVSEGQVRQYIVGAMAYYIQRGNTAEIRGTFDRLTNLVTQTPDMAKQIGDMFYDAALYDYAVREYRVVLAADPGRKDVLDRLASYYVKLGDTAMEKSRLQDAYDQYSKASETDPFHPTAEKKRLEAKAKLEDRETRGQAARASLDEAVALRTEADNLINQRKFGEALSVLQRSQEAYAAVPEEFAAEYLSASNGKNDVLARLNELRGKLVENAQTLSGTGFMAGASRMAERHQREFDQQMMRRLQTEQIAAAFGKLHETYDAAITFK